MFPGVGHGNGHAVFRDLSNFMFKTGVAESISKGVSGRDGLFLKPAVAYIDILGVFLVFQVTVSVAESIGTGVILIAFAPGVGQFPAGADRTGKNIRQSIAALHATLAEKQYRIHRDLVQNGEIQHTAAVKHKNELSIMFSQQTQAVFFYVREQIVPLFCASVAAFARLTGENINCRVRLIRQFIRMHLGAGRAWHGMLSDDVEHLHSLKNIILLNIRFQPAAPCSDIPVKLFLETIHPEGGRKQKSGVSQSLLNGDAVPLPHVAAAASTFDGHAAAGTIKGDFLRFQRQHAVIFQQNDAFCRCGSCQRAVFPLPQRLLRGSCSKCLKFHGITPFQTAR